MCATIKQSGPDRGDPSVSVVIAVVVDLLYSLGLYVDNTVFFTIDYTSNRLLSKCKFVLIIGNGCDNHIIID